MALIDCIVLALALLPLAIALSNIGMLRTPPLAGNTPAVSVLIPARNEAAHIGRAVQAVLASHGCTIELLVLDDGSTDATPDILAANRDGRLRVLSGAGLPPGWSGKQHACATLAAQASHDLMVFVDADVVLATDAVSRMAQCMQAQPELGLASGFPRQITHTWSEWLLLPLIHLLLLGYRPQRLDRNPRVASFAAGCGQLFIVRASAYRQMGGHASIRASMHDGLKLPRAFRRAGFPTALFDATSFARCRMYTCFAEVWEGLGKNATEGMATRRALPIWTVLLAGGHVAPFLLEALSPGLLPLSACLVSLTLRIGLALRFRQDPRGIMLSPLGVLLMLVVQWNALIRAARGQHATWRGRAYPMQ